MASGTWTAAVNNQWSNVGNWVGGVPVQGAGDTATFDGSEGASGLPDGTDGQPVGPGAINLTFNADYSGDPIDANIFHAKGATIGVITVQGSGSAEPDADFTSASVAGTLIINNGPASVAGDVQLDGGTMGASGAGAKLDGAVTVTASDGYITWGSGNFDIDGSIDAGGDTVTHQNCDGSALTCDTDATNLDLGSILAALQTLAIDVSMPAGGNTVTKTTEKLVCGSTVGGGFDLTQGTFDAVSFDVDCYGDLTYTAGNLSNSGGWIQWGANNADWNSSAQKLAAYVVAAGATITLTGYVYTAKATITGDVADSGANRIYIQNGAAGWWGAQTGDLRAGLGCRGTTEAGPANDITILADKPFLYIPNGDRTLTMDASLSIGAGAVTIYRIDAAGIATLDMQGNALTCGAIALGDAGDATKHGKIDFGEGRHSIAGLARANAGDNSNAAALDSSYIQITGGGTFDSAGIGVSATAEVVHIEGLGTATIQNTDETSTANGAPVFGGVTSTVDVNDTIFGPHHVGNTLQFTGGGSYVIDSVTDSDTVEVVGDASGEPDLRPVTVSNCDGNVIHAHNTTQGAKTNGVLTDVTYDQHAPPGSKMLMGAGV